MRKKFGSNCTGGWLITNKQWSRVRDSGNVVKSRENIRSKDKNQNCSLMTLVNDLRIEVRDA